MADEPRFSLQALVTRAILLRMAVAIALHVTVAPELFAPDQQTYHGVAASLASYWEGLTIVFPPRLTQQSGPVGYFYLVAGIYAVFGPFALLPKLLNSVVGGLNVGLIHDIALRTTDSPGVAARAARYAAYFPSLVLWSALNIRDVWIIGLVLLICREALLLQERMSYAALLRLAAAILLVTKFRDYIFLAVTAPMLVSFVIRKRQHLIRNLVVGMLLASVVIYLDQRLGSQRHLRTLDFEELQYLRRWNTVGAASSFGQDVDISTPGKALAFLPIGLAYFLLAPFPWSISGVRQALAMPEMLFFYSLLPAIFHGARWLVRERLTQGLLLLLLAAGLTFGYALGEGNAGTAYRHRAQVLGFYLILGAAGVELRQRARGRAADAALAASRPSVGMA